MIHYHNESGTKETSADFINCKVGSQNDLTSVNLQLQKNKRR